MSGYAPLSKSVEETGVRGRIMKDARARAAASCAQVELGCLYQLTDTDIGWWVRMEPHPFLAPDSCAWSPGGGLSYLYSREGGFVREMLDL